MLSAQVKPRSFRLDGASWSAIAMSILVAAEPAAACAKLAFAPSFRDNVIDVMERVAETEQSSADFRQFLLNWQKCFTKENVTAENAAPIIEACDRASAFSTLEPIERERACASARQSLGGLGSHGRDEIGWGRREWRCFAQGRKISVPHIALTAEADPQR